MTKNNPSIDDLTTKKNVDKSTTSQPSMLQNQLSDNSLVSKHLSKAMQRSYRWLNTGYPELNSLLKTEKEVFKETDNKLGGWPLGTTTEIGLAKPGIGELRLFIPALRTLIDENAVLPNVILINPPHVPYAPALKKAKLDPACLTIISTNNRVDALWAAEQALSAKCCAAVLTWMNAHPMSQKEARRLQLAAERSGTLHVLFRHTQYLEHSSPFRLKIGLAAQAHTQLKVTIVKQPFSWGGQQCVLSLLPHYESWQRMHVAALPVPKHFTPAKPRQLEVLAKAKHVNKVTTIVSKQLMLAKVS